MEDKEIVTKEEGEEKKSVRNKVLIVIIIIILLLIIVVGFGFFLGSGNSNSDKKEEDKVVDENKKIEDEEDNENKKIEDEVEDEIQLEQLTVDSAVVKELFKIFREDSYEKSNVWSSEYTDFENKMYIAFSSLTDSDLKTVKCGTLDVTYAFDKTGSIYHCGTYFSDKADKYYVDNDWVNFGKELVDNTVTTVSSQDLRSAYKKIFGINSNYNDETLSLYYNTLLYYDSNADVYAKFSCQCGGEMGEVSQKIDSIFQEGSKLVLKTSFDKGSSEKINYTFEYEKETGNYIFVSRVVE